MIKTVDELKDLILWAKEQRIAELDVAGVSVKFSPLAFIGDYADVSEAKTPTNENITVTGALTPDQGTDPKDDEDLLLWSAR
jgi:hypothetical protein